MELNVEVSVCVLACLMLLLESGLAKKADELKIETEYQPESCYEFAQYGDQVTVHYTGRLLDGSIFDTSYQPERGPLPFKLGEGKVIPGWEQGIKGMCVGERRRLTIPPHLAYGERGVPPQIPPHATLLFDTELVSVEKPSMEFDVIPFLQFLAMPVGAIAVCYYLYTNYKKQDAEIRDQKGEKRGRKKRH